jgi:hypothetical protein
MGGVLDLSDRLLRGETTVEEVHPLAVDGDLDEVASGIGFIPAFGNVTAFAVGDALLLVDTGNRFRAQVNFERRPTAPAAPAPTWSPTSWSPSGSTATS